MELKSSNLSVRYFLVLVLTGSLFSTTMALPEAAAGHDNIIIDIDDEYDQDETFDIEGSIEDVDEDIDEVTITVTDPDNDDIDDDVQLDDDEFTYEYETGNIDGIYTVEVEYDNDNLFSFFLVDEDPDDVDVETDENTYQQGDTVEISGVVEDPQTGENEVEITVRDPHGDFVVDEESEDVDDEDNDFSFEFELDDDAPEGRYAVTVVYDGEAAGWIIFEVEEGSGSSNDEITAQLADTSLSPGDEVIITGSVDETDVEPGEEVTLQVRDADGSSIESASDEPNNDGFFRFEFDLDDDAESGTYRATIRYTGYPDKVLTFTVSTGGSSSGGSGSTSGSNAGLTARLSKNSLLAGETFTVNGVVPRINSDELVNIVVLGPDSRFVGVSAFPEPDDDRSYSASLRLPSTLEAEDDYSVVVSYDNKDVKIFFDITGKASGSSGGPITVRTDRTSYSAGSTVRISGQIAPDTMVPGEQIALQVYNPDGSPYRFDPIAPESDGSYSYSMVVGGPLGVTGEWDVKVTYANQNAETSFDLTGGAPSSPRFNLRVDDRTYQIEYQSDGTVKNMFVRPLDKKLVVSLEAEADGTLTIILPREVIDSSEGGADKSFIVVTSDIDNGAEAVIRVVESSTTASSRTLVIDYDEGTDLIEIQGTSVVPEFGILSGIVLILGVIAVLALVKSSSVTSIFHRRW